METATSITPGRRAPAGVEVESASALVDRDRDAVRSVAMRRRMRMVWFTFRLLRASRKHVETERNGQNGRLTREITGFLVRMDPMCHRHDTPEGRLPRTGIGNTRSRCAS